MLNEPNTWSPSTAPTEIVRLPVLPVVDFHAPVQSPTRARPSSEASVRRSAATITRGRVYPWKAHDRSHARPGLAHVLLAASAPALRRLGQSRQAAARPDPRRTRSQIG